MSPFVQTPALLLCLSATLTAAGGSSSARFPPPTLALQPKPPALSLSLRQDVWFTLGNLGALCATASLAALPLTSPLKTQSTMPGSGVHIW